jgi:polyisoprenoid-binding protein YceI
MISKGKSMKKLSAALTVLCLIGGGVVASHAQTNPKIKAKATVAAAPSWTIDPRQSRIGFSTRWAGEAVNGSFRQWTGDIKFDPNNLVGSKAIILVQTGSALTGVKEPDENLGGEDWLNARRFPTARYETTAIRSVGPGRYVADGTLTMKGVAYRLALPFSVSIAGNVATMTGQATLDRMTLRLGLESDASAQWVARETVVNVAVRATRR